MARQLSETQRAALVAIKEAGGLAIRDERNPNVLVDEAGKRIRYGEQQRTLEFRTIWSLYVSGYLASPAGDRTRYHLTRNADSILTGECA